MEIERKFLVPCLPEGYDIHPFYQVEQVYLYMEPMARIRQENGSLYPICKGRGFLSREEYSLPLIREAYVHSPPKVDGVIFTKKHYLIPLDGSDRLIIELDVFEGRYAGPLLAEVGFISEEEAMVFQAPKWFEGSVAFTREYQNSRSVCEKQRIQRKRRFVRP